MQIVIDIPEEVVESKKYCEYFGAWSDKLQETIENGKERKTGKWIRQNDKSRPMYGWYICTECGSCIGDTDGVNYCSWCGAENEVDDADSD